MIRGLIKEWNLHERSLSDFALWAIVTYRFGAWLAVLPRGPIRWTAFKAYFAMAKTVEIASGIWIGHGAELGANVHLVHSGNIKIHREARVGAGTSIMHDVTLGMNMGRPGLPQVGENVLIGAGAKLLGGIHVGDGATIAPNSLVITDVPAGATAMGVPARMLPNSARSPKTVLRSV